MRHVSIQCIKYTVKCDDRHFYSNKYFTMIKITRIRKYLINILRNGKFHQYFIEIKHSTDKIHYKFPVALNNNDHSLYLNKNLRPKRSNFIFTLLSTHLRAVSKSTISKIMKSPLRRKS